MKKIIYKLNIGLVAMLLTLFFASCNDVEYTGIVLDAPVAGFAIPDSSDIGLNGRVLTANTSVNGVDYFWYINDSLVSEEIEPVLSFTKLGSTTLKMVAQNGVNGNFLTSEFEQTYEVTASAFAYFTADTIAKKGVEFSVMNKSARATNYLWDFGDDSTSTEESPVHIFAEAGDYTITLTVKNEDGVETAWTSDVTVVAPLLEENFTDTVPLPEGWTAIDGGTSDNTWSAGFYSSYNNKWFYYDYVSMSAGSFSNADGVDDWLATPKVTYDGEAALIFDIWQSINPEFSPAIPVKIWIAKKAPESGADFTIPLGEVNLTVDDTRLWITKEFSLKEHVSEGEEFYIGFHVDAVGASPRLDNIVIQ